MIILHIFYFHLKIFELLPKYLSFFFFFQASGDATQESELNGYVNDNSEAKKQFRVPLITKLKAIEEVDMGMPIAEVSSRNNVDPRTLKFWLSNRSVLESYKKIGGDVAPNNRFLEFKNVQTKSVNVLVFEWFNEERRNGRYVTMDQVIQRANATRKIMCKKQGNYDKRWVVAWMKKYGIASLDPSYQCDVPLKDLRVVLERIDVSKYLKPTNSNCPIVPAVNIKIEKPDVDARLCENNIVKVEQKKTIEKLNEQLYEWYNLKRIRGKIVNRRKFLIKALEFFAVLRNGAEEFNASDEWLNKWQSKYNVNLDEADYLFDSEKTGPRIECFGSAVDVNGEKVCEEEPLLKNIKCEEVSFSDYIYENEATVEQTDT